jgi:aminoglycoside 6'-N-acetyltransferase
MIGTSFLRNNNYSIIIMQGSSIIFQTERLIIKKMTLTEAPTFMAYRNDALNARYQSWEPNYTLETATQFISKYMQYSFPSPNNWNQLAIFEQKSSIHIGDIAFKLSDDEKQGEIGYILDRKFQGYGFMNEALTHFFKFLFHNLKLHRITAICDRKNIASIKVLEHLGMRREGQFFKNIWFKGAWGDEYLYAILEEEWKH